MVYYHCENCKIVRDERAVIHEPLGPFCPLCSGYIRRLEEAEVRVTGGSTELEQVDPPALVQVSGDKARVGVARKNSCPAWYDPATAWDSIYQRNMLRLSSRKKG